MLTCPEAKRKFSIDIHSIGTWNVRRMKFHMAGTKMAKHSLSENQQTEMDYNRSLFTSEDYQIYCRQENHRRNVVGNIIRERLSKVNAWMESKNSLNLHSRRRQADQYYGDSRWCSNQRQGKQKRNRSMIICNTILQHQQ